MSRTPGGWHGPLVTARQVASEGTTVCVGRSQAAHVWLLAGPSQGKGRHLRLRRRGQEVCVLAGICGVSCHTRNLGHSRPKSRSFLPSHVNWERMSDSAWAPISQGS